MMRPRILSAICALFLVAIAPTLAQAANAFVTGNVNIRSGPGTQYGRLATIPAGAAVTIRGCLSGYSWCDVRYAGRNGWVSSNYLQAIYQNRRRPLIYVGPRIRLPVISYHRPRPPHLRPRPPRPPHWNHRPRPPHGGHRPGRQPR